MTDIEQLFAGYYPSAEAQETDHTTVTIPTSLQGDFDATVATTPHAADLAKKHGIALHTVPATGRGNRVTVADLQNAVEAAGGALPFGYDRRTSGAIGTDEEVGYVEKPLPPARSEIADRLKKSYLDSPAFRVTAHATIDKLLALRTEINESRLDVKVTVDDLVVAAVAKTLIAVPEINVHYDEANQTVRHFTHADIAMTVATDEGFITPIITRANARSITEIADVVRDLNTRAKAGTLKPDELQGGTFTISNLGMFGVTQFDAIINPPSAAILAVAAGTEQFKPDADGQPVVQTVLPLTLTSDHRVVDGALAAKFLAQLRTFLETPALIFA